MSATKGILNFMAYRKATGSISFLRLSIERKGYPSRKYFSSQPSTAVSTAEGQSGDGGGDVTIVGERASISKAMHAYLKRANENQEFMSKMENEFVLGRRHLANMMGKDPENFTQDDIDEAIRYLFPSGLYDKKARPKMKPPMEIYPKQKAAQFDSNGRPHHPFFYTAKPNFYFLLHEMVGKLNLMNKLSISMSGADLSNDTSLAGSVWLTKEELEERLLEKITDPMYSEWTTCFERIASHPNRNREIDFINKYRKPLQVQAKTDSLPPVTLEPDGRKTAHVTFLAKKTARGDVIVTLPGTGEFTINGKGLEYFKLISNREAVISPLQLAGWLGKVDVVANVVGGTEASEHLPNPGETSRAICVRFGIAQGIAALGADIEKLRLAGFLTPDWRGRERSKVAHDGARAAWTWKKR